MRYVKAGRRLRVEVYLMFVTAAHAHWPEQDLRRRLWVPPGEAESLVAYEGFASCVAALHQRLRAHAA
jgi:hypothetical protein